MTATPQLDAETSVPNEPDPMEVHTEIILPTAMSLVETNIARMKDTIATQLAASQMMIQFQREIRSLVIANARPSHWKRFGTRVRPDGAECLRLRSLLGVGVEITPPTRTDYTDADGEYYVYACSGRVWFGPEDHPVILVPCYGSASSRTPFFAKDREGWKSVREINPSFIAKMAWSECLKNGIVLMFGLDLEPGELEALAGGASDTPQAPAATPSDTAAPFAGGKDHAAQDDPETSAMRQEVAAKIWELAKGNKEIAEDWLEDLTTFKGDKGLVRGKRSARQLTAKQVANLHKRKDSILTAKALEAFIARTTVGH